MGSQIPTRLPVCPLFALPPHLCQVLEAAGVTLQSQVNSSFEGNDSFVDVSLRYTVDRAESTLSLSGAPSLLRTCVPTPQYTPCIPNDGPPAVMQPSPREHSTSKASKRQHKHSPSKRRRHVLFREWRRLARMNDDLFVFPCRRPTSPQEPDTELYQDVDVAPVIPMTVLDERSVHADSLSPGEQDVSDCASQTEVLKHVPESPMSGSSFLSDSDADICEVPLGDDDGPSEADVLASLAHMDSLYRKALLLERGSFVPSSTTVDDAPGDSVVNEDLPDSDPSSPRYLFYLLESASGIT